MADPSWYEWAFWARSTDDLRNLALIVGGGLAAIVGLVLASIRTIAADRSSKAALAQSALAVKRQVTEAFTAAIGQLGHSNDLEVRIGAIYALGELAKTSLDHHWPIMETLAVYVREHSRPPRGSEEDASEPPGTEPEPVRLEPDIEAVVAVLCGRVANQDPPDQRLDLSGSALQYARMPGVILSKAFLKKADLRGVDLRGANLFRADLRGANLFQADLREANLREADLREANLGEAILVQADLRGANLSEAYLCVAFLNKADLINANLGTALLAKAILVQADLSKANLQRADLNEANLQRANLSDANLEHANLIKAKLQGATVSGAKFGGVYFEDTIMPDGGKYSGTGPPPDWDLSPTSRAD